MRLCILAVVAVWSGSAIADPGPPADRPCRVTILRAPDRVRAEIEALVAAERRCSRSLELRVVPSEGGLYVFARDDDGHVRERVVPDDQSIGALVVSWIADDAPPAAVAASPAAVAASPAGEAVVAEPAAEPPASRPFALRGAPRANESRDATPAIDRSSSLSPTLRRMSAPVASGLAAAFDAPDPRQDWLMLVGALSVSEHHKFGVRGDLDLGGRGWWTAGLAAALIENSQSLVGISMTTVSGFVAAEAARGDWQLRAQAGVGATVSWLRNYCNCDQMGIPARVSMFTTRPIAEISALVGHALGTKWSFAGGALVTAGILDYGFQGQDRVSLMLFAGFRNRL